MSASFSSSSQIYTLNHQARALTAQYATSEQHHFLVATLNSKDNNEIHSIAFNDVANVISCPVIYSHPNEVWHMSTSPAHSNKFFTVYHTGEDWGAKLWRMCDKITSDVLTTPSDLDSLSPASAASAAAPPPRATEHKRPTPPAEERPKVGSDGKEVKGGGDDDEGYEKLEQLLELKGHTGRIKSVLWQAQEDSQRAVSLDDECLRLWNIEKSGTGLKDAAIQTKPIPNLTSGCWDPLHTTIFASVGERSVRIWDWRHGGRESQLLDRAHSDVIRDIDYNPNKPYHIVTSGDDRRLRIWDLRKPQQPLKTLGSHSHSVCAVKFNRFHDQLVLSGGTDSSVVLWSIVSCSSAPLGELENPVNEKEGDKMIKSYDDHPESVYSIAWSSSDAWIFASLSYDGQLVVNHVPPAEKYKILL